MPLIFNMLILIENNATLLLISAPDLDLWSALLGDTMIIIFPGDPSVLLKGTVHFIFVLMFLNSYATIIISRGLRSSDAVGPPRPVTCSRRVFSAGVSVRL